MPKVAAVIGLCVVGIVVAALLLWPRGDDAPPLPAVTTVRFSATDLAQALDDQVDRLRAADVTDAVAGGRFDELLDQDPIDLRIPQLTEQGITARDVVVRRHGGEAAIEATVDPAQLASFAPGSVEDLAFDADASRPNELVIHGTASALGFDVPVTVKVVIRDGAVVAVPDGLPIDDIVVFDDPRIRVRGIRAEPVSGGVRLRAVADVVG